MIPIVGPFFSHLLSGEWTALLYITRKPTGGLKYDNRKEMGGFISGGETGRTI
jgi:hypothetical protein